MKYLILLILLIQSNSVKADTWKEIKLPDLKVQISFVNKNINDVANWYSKNLQVPIIVDPKFNKNIYLVSPNKISFKDSLLMLETYLKFYGYQIEYKNKILIIDKTIEKVKENETLDIVMPKAQDLEIKVFQLKNNSSENISRIINEIFFPTSNLDFIWNFLSNNPQFFNITR